MRYFNLFLFILLQKIPANENLEEMLRKKANELIKSTINNGKLFI